MLIGIHELDCARTCFGESSGGFSAPSGIDLGGLIGVVNALKQNVSDDRATISVERENVSNQPCSVRCHKPSLPGRPLPHRASFAAARTGYGCSRSRSLGSVQIIFPMVFRVRWLRCSSNPRWVFGGGGWRVSAWSRVGRFRGRDSLGRSGGRGAGRRRMRSL